VSWTPLSEVLGGLEPRPSTIERNQV